MERFVDFVFEGSVRLVIELRHFYEDLAHKTIVAARKLGLTTGTEPVIVKVQPVCLLPLLSVAHNTAVDPLPALFGPGAALQYAASEGGRS